MRSPLALSPPGPAAGRVAALLALIAALVAGEAACSSASGTVTLTPLTGIMVPASELTALRGCGPESGKVFKYAAVVSPVSSDPMPSVGFSKGVYDCFADALFTNLPYGNDGTARYTIEIRTFGASEYEAQKATIDELSSTGAVLDLAKFRALSGARFACTATLRLDVVTRATCGTDRGGPAPGVDAGVSPSADGGDASTDGGDASTADAAASDASDALAPSDAAGD